MQRGVLFVIVFAFCCRYTVQDELTNEFFRSKYTGEVESKENDGTEYSESAEKNGDYDSREIPDDQLTNAEKSDHLENDSVHSNNTHSTTSEVPTQSPEYDSIDYPESTLYKDHEPSEKSTKQSYDTEKEFLVEDTFELETQDLQYLTGEGRAITPIFAHLIMVLINCLCCLKH